MYLPCSGLNNEDEGKSAPLTEALYCTSTRRALSRYARETDETPTTENEREMHMRRACARQLSPRSFLLLEQSLLSIPSPQLDVEAPPALGRACE